MKRAGIIVGIVLIAAAYVLGFWPQYQNARQAQQELAATTIELSRAQAKVRLATLQDRLLALIAKTSDKDYGQAAGMSTQFFNQVREEESSRTDPQEKTALASILRQRDAVTADLAKGDPGALGALNAIEGVMFTLVDHELGGVGTAGAGR